MDGRARWLAYQRSCRVTGFDCTERRVAGAMRLTERVRLDRTLQKSDLGDLENVKSIA